MINRTGSRFLKSDKQRFANAFKIQDVSANVFRIRIIDAKKRAIVRSEIFGRAFVRFFCASLILLCFFNIRAERLPVNVFTSADGLGSSFINAAMRDSRGFLWLATRDGLSRFDGSRFITYQVGTKDAPPGIEHIYETSRGIYWITTTSGLYRYDPRRTPAAPPAENNERPILNAKFINDRRDYFYEDKDGKLWALGGDLNLLEERDGRFSFQKIELNLPANPAASFYITDFRQARDGSF